MFCYHPIYRQANLNLLRTPHVSHKMKSHYRTETRTKKNVEKYIASATPSTLVAAYLNHACFRTLLFPSLSRFAFSYMANLLWQAPPIKSCSFLVSTRLEVARDRALSQTPRKVVAVCQVLCRVEVPKWRVSLPQDGGPMPPSTNTTLVKVSVLWSWLKTKFVVFGWVELWMCLTMPTYGGCLCFLLCFQFIIFIIAPCYLFCFHEFLVLKY